MKLKMNKACDLNSISVLPPPSRRSSMVMAQQPRSQPSQQSFSQGVPSQQNAMFSQLSQTSFDEALTENQRFGSQDKDNSAKRVSCLASVSYPREESQMPVSMSSANITRRWSSASPPDQKCQLSGELEHKFATMESLLSRFGMILDSVQADIMQVNKGTKELSLTVEGIRQKSIAHDDSLHLLNRGQEEIKTSLDAGLRSISNQLCKVTQQEKVQEFLSTVVTSLDQIEVNIREQTKELSRCFSGDLQTIICNLETLNQKDSSLAILPPKVTGGESSLQNSYFRREPIPAKLPMQGLLVPKVTGGDSSLQKPVIRREPAPTNMSKQGPLVPKIELVGWKTVKEDRVVSSNQYGNWKTVKEDRVASSNQYGNSYRNLKQRRFSPLARPLKVVVNLDDDSDDDFSCFIVEKDLDTYLSDEVNEEAERILRKARRRKRKQSFKSTFLTQRR